ncbi:hypothetical protein LCGC14_0532110 [marine sediment metagenome]|uniref:Uncharacterized protein n=1 Tax=marine sediment metagenome TaxID=412755 RepID=A0A0F9SDL3_9ZZZZ
MPIGDSAFIRSARKRFKAGASDAAFTAKITKGFQSGQMTPTDIFAAIGARGAPTGRKVPPRRPPVGSGGTGIPGPVGVAPGPGMVAPGATGRIRRRSARGAPGTAARGRRIGRANVRAKQEEFRESIFPRGMTRARFGAEQRMKVKKAARGRRGTTRASAEATARIQDKEQLQLGRVQSLQTRIGFF